MLLLLCWKNTHCADTQNWDKKFAIVLKKLFFRKGGVVTPTFQNCISIAISDLNTNFQYYNLIFTLIIGKNHYLDRIGLWEVPDIFLQTKPLSNFICPFIFKLFKTNLVELAKNLWSRSCVKTEGRTDDRQTDGQTDIARSTCLFILIKNIYIF